MSGVPYWHTAGNCPKCKARQVWKGGLSARPACACGWKPPKGTERIDAQIARQYSGRHTIELILERA